MQSIRSFIIFTLLSFLSFILCSCSTYSSASNAKHSSAYSETSSVDYADRLPAHIDTSEKVVIVNPRVHAWGAYNASGNLVKAGLATAGNSWCPDIRRACRTKVGSFRVYSLGNAGCKSSIYPLPHGGAPMPYCMFFNRNQALHGASNSHVVEGNISHGCVRLHVSDAEWLRFNFINVGTKVIVKPY